MSDTKTPRCSIIVPTYNRGEDLRACLDSIAAQTVRDFELLVVDDGSTDATREVIAEFQKAHPTITVNSLRHENNRGCAAARNTGITASHGELLIFTDDDCIVPPEWVAAHLDAHARYPDAAGIGGWYWPTKKTLRENKYEQFYELLFDATYPNMRECEVITNTMRSPAGNTANMSYKRAALAKLKGFDAHLPFTAGVDWELKARAIAEGMTLVSILLSVEHRKRFTFRTFVRKSILQGRGMHYRFKKFGLPPNPTLLTGLGMCAEWATSPVTRGKRAGTHALWVLSLVVGRWLNIVSAFSPGMMRMLVSPRYFLTRLRGENVLTHSETRQFVGIFDPYAGREAPFVSVIIPTYNRRALVREALSAVLRQDYPPESFEVIVVDDGSTDKTAEDLERFREMYPRHDIRIVKQENSGAAIARNRGAREARGEILFFTDSDCRVPGSWIARHLAVYQAFPEIAGVGGGMLSAQGGTYLDRYRDGFADNRFVAKYRDMISFGNDIENVVSPYDTANLSIKKEVFEEVQGFIPIGGSLLYHEDVDFSFRVQKKGYQFALVTNVPVRNERRLNLRDFARTAYIRGFALPHLIGRLAPQAIDVARAPRLILIVNACLQFLLWPFDAQRFAHLVHTSCYTIGFLRGKASI